MSVGNRGADLVGSHIVLRIRQGEAALPAFRFDLTAHHNIADCFGIRFLRGVARANIDHVAEGVGHVFAGGHFDDDDRLASQILGLHRNERLGGNAFMQALLQHGEGIRRSIHTGHRTAVVHAANEVTTGGVEKSANDPAKGIHMPHSGLELHALPFT